MSNKYQEALDTLKAKYTLTSDNGKVLLGIIDLSQTHKNEFNTLQELVDKETPMKVVKWENAKPITRCPKCGAGLERKDSYCWECGQKIDWSEE